jgi:hypothetical protein
MSAKSRILFGLTAINLLGMSPAAMAAVHFDRTPMQITSAWRAPSRHSPVVLAEDDEQQWRHDGDRDWRPHDWDHANGGRNGGGYGPGPDAYYWGGRDRYNYSPGWFNPPPQGWSDDRRRTYLEERRHVAINMQQQMLARGDTRAAQRLGAVIDQLNHQLRYR